MSGHGPEGYEKSDVDVAAIVRFTVGLAGGLIVCCSWSRAS
jgi:hypothetical protein